MYGPHRQVWSACLCPCQIHVEILMTSGMVLGVGAFGGYLDLEGGALMSGINAHIKETSQSSLALPMGSTIYEPGSEPLSAPTLNLPVP